MTEYRYHVHKGDSLVIDVTYKVAEGDETPEPVNLTGWSATLGVTWPSGFLILTSEADQIALGGLSGTLLCDAVDSSPFPIGEHTAYQLRLTDSLGREKTLLAGTIRVHPAPVERVT